uniref:GED domain-containing protein n=1 Tax=Oryzias latipes TaxID=8090 RepID=A0A3P9IX69_ORYLA
MFVNPQLERQVETLFSLVDSYMNIIYKTIKDLMPKTIMHLLINSVKEFIRSELLVQLCAQGDCAVLMDKSPEQSQRWQEVQPKQAALQEALRIIAEIDTFMRAPPPSTSTWLLGQSFLPCSARTPLKSAVLPLPSPPSAHPAVNPETQEVVLHIPTGGVPFGINTSKYTIPHSSRGAQG